MALLISSADLALALALALALEAGTFRLVVRESSYGLGEFYSLEDDHGVIEVANSHEEAVTRIKQVEEALS